MKYKVQSIGASFSQRAIDGFQQQLNDEAGSGWELHTVFSVQKTGCLGVNEGVTYLAVFKKP